MLLFKFFLLFLTLITSSQALFFHYSKNALWNFFDSLKAKKEFKKLPNIHHYHVHYYPVFLHSSHSLIKTVKAPDNHEIENLHSNKLESYGWSGDYKYTPDVIQSYPSWDPWSSTFSYTKQPWALNKRSLDQAVDTAKSDAGVVVQVPLQQQIIVQQPKNDEDTSNPILTFFRRLRDIKNSIFSPATERSDVVNSKMDGLVVFTKPNADLEDFHQLSDEQANDVLGRGLLDVGNTTTRSYLRSYYIFMAWMTHGAGRGVWRSRSNSPERSVFQFHNFSLAIVSLNLKIFISQYVGLANGKSVPEVIYLDTCEDVVKNSMKYRCFVLYQRL